MTAPILMYHGTETGKDGATLKSFAKGIVIAQGIMPIANQKQGFYVTSQGGILKATEEIDLGEEFSPRNGNPVIVTALCSFGANFELDYEEAAPIAKALFRQFQNHLSSVPPMALKLPESCSIAHIVTVSDEEREGLNITVIEDHTHTEKTIFMPWDEQMRGVDIAEAGLLQTFRDYLVETLGTGYLKREERHIRKAIEEDAGEEMPTGISMKCTGGVPPQIVAIEVHNGQSWERYNSGTSSPAAPVQSPSPKPP